MKNIIIISVIIIWSLYMCAAEKLEKGKKLFKEGDYVEAMKIFDEILADDKIAKNKKAEACIIYAEIYQINELFDKAALFYKRSINYSPISDNYYKTALFYSKLIENSNIFRKIFLSFKTKKYYKKAYNADNNNFDAVEGLLYYYFSAPVLLGGGKKKASEFIEELILNKNRNCYLTGIIFELYYDNPDKAVSYLRQLNYSDKDSEILLRQKDIFNNYYKKGDYIKYFNKLLTLYNMVLINDKNNIYASLYKMLSFINLIIYGENINMEDFYKSIEQFSSIFVSSDLNDTDSSLYENYISLANGIYYDEENNKGESEKWIEKIEDSEIKEIYKNYKYMEKRRGE